MLPSMQAYQLLSKIVKASPSSLCQLNERIVKRKMTNHSVSAAIQAANQSLQSLVESGGFDKVLEKVKVVSVGPGRVTAEVLLEKHHLNRGGFAHGGFLATLVDSISTLAVMDFSDQNAVSNPGVSIDLNVQFMAPANNNSTLVIESETLKKGQSITFMSVNILNKENRRLIARGSHIKYAPKQKL